MKTSKQVYGKAIKPIIKSVPMPKGKRVPMPSIKEMPRKVLPKRIPGEMPMLDPFKRRMPKKRMTK